MTTTIKKAVLGALTCLTSTAGLLLSPSQAAAVELPTANCGTTATSNCLRANDFNIFSLALLDLQNPTGGYDLPASPGQIAPYTIIGQNNGQEGAGNLAGFVDGTYATPSNNTASTFSTVTANTGGVADPKVANGGGSGANEFIGDSENSWDIRVNTLKTLNGTPIVFFFSFNETGSNSGLLDTDLLIWGKVTLAKDDGSSTKTFYLGGQPTVGDTPLSPGNTLPAANGPDTDFTNQATYDYGPWIYVHAGICVVGTQFVGFPDSTGTCNFGSSKYVNTNLGNDTAAFMVNSPELDAAVQSGGYDTMQVTWEMAYLNGGGESAWIAPVTTPTRVPEPAPLALLSLGLGALVWNTRRNRRR